MKKNEFVAQKVGGCNPDMKRFPEFVAKARYNVYGNAMNTMLKPFMNGVYGMMGNVIFVASQNYDPTMKVVQGLLWCDVTVTGRNAGWKSTPRQDLVCFIILAQTAKEITLRKWRAPRQSKSVSEMKEQRMFSHLQTNSDSVIRRQKGLVKKMYHEEQKDRERRAANSYEYQVYNMVRYGNFDVEQSNFIEGSGLSSHYDNRDRRPPMPQFPEKCHKVTKRK